VPNGSAQVEAVAKALSTFGHDVRNTTSEAGELEDADTAELLTVFQPGSTNGCGLSRRSINHKHGIKNPKK
jgi:hypothetical protein